MLITGPDYYGPPLNKQNGICDRNVRPRNISPPILRPDWYPKLRTWYDLNSTVRDSLHFLQLGVQDLPHSVRLENI